MMNPMTGMAQRPSKTITRIEVMERSLASVRICSSHVWPLIRSPDYVTKTLINENVDQRIIKLTNSLDPLHDSALNHCFTPIEIRKFVGRS